MSTGTTRARRTVFGLACLGVLGLVAFLGSSAPSVGAAESFPGQGFLPHNRAWEMVSPPEKNGGDVLPHSRRTRAAADGSALQFTSLAGFGDVHGIVVGTEYLAQRSTDPDPGDNGWATHGITPPQAAYPGNALIAGIEPFYPGDFSADLDSGVFFAYSPLTDDPNVEDVPNLYVRDDLRAPGAGSYQLASACPLCAETEPLPPLPKIFSDPLRPVLAGASADFGHVIFESRFDLTADAAAAQSELCDPSSFFVVPFCRPRLYEWDHGTTRLAGILPDESGADVSVAGRGAGNDFLTPHTASDGSDGHSRIFFTQPTNGAGQTSSEEPFDSSIAEKPSGNLFVRVDHTSTAQLNASERDPLLPASSFAPAEYLDASADGKRAFFMTTQALTDDAPADGAPKIYMYDTTKPASAPDNLTFMTPDAEPADGANARGMIGASEDGHYAYLLVTGQLVEDEPTNGVRIYLWHDGAITHIGPAPKASEGLPEVMSSAGNWKLDVRQARVTPDGRHLLFSTINGTGLLSAYGGSDYDHGSCPFSSFGGGCREHYLYSADDDSLQCASCNPSGAPATAMATTVVAAFAGATKQNSYENRNLSDDGRYAFFSTAERLVSEDINGIEDAYAYDTTSGKPSLLSSGQSNKPSYLLEASADGSDAFIVTNERLSGWDIDTSYDVYDARVGGGFPEPPPPPPSCQGDACQPAPTSLNDPTPASSSFSGPGNQASKPKAVRCRKGQRKVKARGKTRCVRKKKNKRTAKHNWRAGR